MWILMRVYPPPPSTAPRSDRHWQIHCEDCGRIEYYPDRFPRSAVRPIMDRLARQHVCLVRIDNSVHDWAEDRFLIPPSHPGYAGNPRSINALPA